MRAESAVLRERAARVEQEGDGGASLREQLAEIRGQLTAADQRVEVLKKRLRTGCPRAD